MTVFGQLPVNLRTLEILFLPCNVIPRWGSTQDQIISDECNHSLEAQQAFLTQPAIQFYFNQEKFNDQSYGEESIIGESELIFIQSSNSEPTWADFSLRTSQLNDETSFIQIGNAEESLFYGQYGKPEIRPSAWNEFPTEAEPNNKYKFTSLTIQINPDLK